MFLIVINDQIERSILLERHSRRYFTSVITLDVLYRYRAGDYFGRDTADTYRSPAAGSCLYVPDGDRPFRKWCYHHISAAISLASVLQVFF